MINRLYSVTEAAEILNVPVSWLRTMVGKRAVPHTPPRRPGDPVAVSWPCCPMGS